MSSFTNINYLAVVVATVVYYTIGFLWYTKLFGTVWRQQNGLPAEPSTKPKASSLLGQFISTWLYTLGIAVLLKITGAGGMAEAASVSAIITVLFIAPIHSGHLFFTGKKKLFFIDVSERALGSLVVATILTIWQ